MNVRYNSVLDLTLTLRWDERVWLLDRKTRHFHDHSLRGVVPELDAYLFLAHSFDDGHLLANAEEIGNNLGRILIPSADLPKSPWLINLSDKGVKFLENEWPYGVRYDGSHKLFIFGGES
jgi:hypothetical protein